jgi:hypothetical protein
MRLFSYIGASGALLLVAFAGSCKRAEAPEGVAKSSSDKAAPTLGSLDREHPSFREKFQDLRSELDTTRNLDGIDLVGMVHSGPLEGMSKEEWYMVVNEIMEATRSTPEGSRTECCKKLMEIYQDEKCLPVVRDYAAQHLTLAIDQENDPAEQSRLRKLAASILADTCHRLDRQTDGPLFGTSLLALAYLMESSDGDGSDIDSVRETLDELICSTIKDHTGSAAAARSSAIQFAARTNNVGALAAIRAAATDDSEDLGVRLGSLHALGQFADPSDKAILEDIAAGNTRLKFASQQALKQYEKDLQN